MSRATITLRLPRNMADDLRQLAAKRYGPGQGHPIRIALQLLSEAIVREQLAASPADQAARLREFAAARRAELATHPLPCSCGQHEEGR